MNIIKKLTAILSVALVAGLGIFGASSVINTQSQKENKQQQENKREERQNKKGETEENESAEKSEAEDNDGEETGDNEPEELEADEPEESEADERAEQAVLAGQAIVSKEQAQAVALHRFDGEVVKSELEDEDGKIVYGFEIRDGNSKVFEVKVDAKTGVVLSAEEDKEDDDDKPDNQRR